MTISEEMVTCSRVADITIADSADPALSIVIVTYGTGVIVEACLAALESTLAGVAHEVIVVDNASGDRHGMPTATRLRLGTAGVRLIVSPTNLGFGGGNDLGIERARADVVCLLNPDAVVESGWVGPLLDAVGDRSVGIAAPVLLDPDGSVQEAGQSIDKRAITRPLRTVPAGDVVDVAYSSAACWMVRREVHRQVGGFDPAYHPAYFEDVDMAFRVHAAGLRTVVVPASRVTHHLGGSTRRRQPPALAQQAIFRRRWAAELGGLTG
jgi:GT2 family glycosyltransferase